MTQDTPQAVAKSATTHASFNLRKTILLGVFGSEADRSALIRLPSGKTARVTRGTKVGSAQVISIDEDRIALKDGPNARWISIPGR